MKQYIDKNKVEEILRNLWKKDEGHNAEHRICYNKALQDATMDDCKNFLTAYDEGKFDALSAVDALLDALQEEPVAPKVLEDMLNAKTAAESLGISQEEHDRIVDELIYGKEPELVDVDDLPNKEEESISENLEEASRNYADNEEYGDDVYFAIKAAFKEGAQWQKEQMMKDAVKTEVCERVTQNGLLPSVTVLVNEFKPGDKVKLIIIKDE